MDEFNVGIIRQNKLILETDVREIAYQFSKNLTMMVELDGYFNGYTLKLSYSTNDWYSDELEYDEVAHKITLPEKAFLNDGNLYIALRAEKGNVVATTKPVSLRIGSSINPNVVE